MKRIVFGAIRPEGRLKEDIQKDMRGCIGHLDELAPSVFTEQQIYGRDRLSEQSGQPDLGRIPDAGIPDEKEDPQLKWWNSESQSNWRDGFCRAAFLLDEEEYRRKADAYLDEILRTQDEDGYLGIYDRNLRYRQTSENGELWAKATLFRTLLGCYEATGSGKILSSVQRALDNLMQGYPVGGKNPFQAEHCSAGICHGLAMADALDEMYELTSEEKYLDYAVWFYEQYSEATVSEEDMQIRNIQNPFYFWKNHGVHAYEHIRAVMIAAYRNEQYRPLLDKVMAELSWHLTPSGGPIGDEEIGGRCADAFRTGYEFCSVLELFDTYAMLLEKSGNLSVADQMEWLYFNAGMGMKHPSESSIMYCKTDNCYEAAGRKYPGDFQSNLRYQYSPVHQTTAVCCVPNMGRLTPHYVQNMYMRNERQVICVLFGSCMYRDEIDGTEFSIRQVSDYPANTKLAFEISAAAPLDFAFCVRKPQWAEKVHCDAPFSEEEGMVCFRSRWMGKQKLTVSFGCHPVWHLDLKGDAWFSNGPLVYALPLPANEKVIRTFPGSHFRETGYMMKMNHVEMVHLNKKEMDSFRHIPAQGKNWKQQCLRGKLSSRNGENEYDLVPMGGTILRRVTFPVY